jgi:selenoprotein W-related protein
VAELLKAFEADIHSITLLPSDGGRFEVVVNGSLVFSKIKTRRHAEPGEVVELVRKLI